MHLLRLALTAAVLLLSHLSLSAQVPKLPDPAAPKNGVRLNAFPLQIPDGTAVVLKKGDALGVVFVTDQKSDPEQCTFRWLLRRDGSLKFHAKAEGLEGTKRGATALKFGPFELEWSVNTGGYGWVYFPDDGDVYMGILVGVKREDLLVKLASVPLIKKVRADTIGLDLNK